ncbi:MAG TPA: hypothetical protein VGA81_13370 [Methylomirabilota bacterium]
MERLSWTICAVIGLPVLVAALIERQIGHAGLANELTWIVLYPIALGTTVSLLGARSFAEMPPRARVLLAPVPFVIVLFTMSVVGINLGIVWP